MRDLSARPPALEMAAWAVLVAAAALPTASAADPAAPAPLDRRERVRVKLDVRGELFAPTGPGAADVRQPFESTARFDFVEAAPAPASSQDPAPAAKPRHGAIAVRHFLSASSDLVIRSESTHRGLREAARTLAVVRTPTVRHFNATALLSPEENELLLLPFDPLMLDEIVPNVAAEESGLEVPAATAAALLTIDTLGKPSAGSGDESSESDGLRSRLVPAEEAGMPDRVVVQGRVQGAVDGVPTSISVDGLLTLEAGSGHVIGAVVRIHERRLAGHISPGFECDATIQVARRPVEGSKAQPPADDAVVNAVEHEWARLHDAADEPFDPIAGRGPGDPGRAWTLDPEGRFGVVHDARWRVVSASSRTMVLRLVDDGLLVAECTVTPLLPAAAGTSTTLGEFRGDVERSLGDKRRATVSESAETRTDGGTALRVVSEGAEGELPLEWRHHLVFLPDGSRVAATFLVEKRLSERLGDADVRFMAGMGLPGAVKPPLKP